VGRTGDDEAGELVRSTLRGAGVEVCGLVDPARPTGLLLRSARTAVLSRVYYYRRGSAGAGLAIDDLKEPLARQPRVLHTTGITPALGPEARAATLDAVALARDAGATISYDVNFRSRLTTTAEAAAVLEAVLADVDILFCGADELGVLGAALGIPDAGADDGIAAALDAELIIKRGRHGAIGRSGPDTAAVDALEVPAVDVVGAGDAFVAGYLSGWLDGLPLRQRLRRAAVLGAFCVAAHGDWEGLPTRSELGLLDESPDYTDR
jgi:2-dehydro-3-deoxygluconokinase